MQRVGQLHLVGRGQDHHVRNGAQVGEVEHAVVRRAVFAHEARAVQAEDHVKVLQCDVHDELVVCPLQERRVDRHDRHATAQGKPRRHPDRVLLGDSHVVEAFGEPLREAVQARAGRHRRRDGDDALVLLRLCHKRLGERLCVAHGAARAVRLAGLDRERSDPVERVGLLLGVLVARALLGHCVDDHRAVRGSGPRDGALHLRDVVAVDRAYVRQPELLEEHPGFEQELLHRLLDGLAGVHHALAQGGDRQTRLHLVAQLHVARIEPHARKVARERPDVLGDRHLVVVEHDHDLGAEMADVVERLERHSARSSTRPR